MERFVRKTEETGFYVWQNCDQTNEVMTILFISKKMHYALGILGKLEKFDLLSHFLRKYGFPADPVFVEKTDFRQKYWTNFKN